MSVAITIAWEQVKIESEEEEGDQTPAVSLGRKRNLIMKNDELNSLDELLEGLSDDKDERGDDVPKEPTPKAVDDTLERLRARIRMGSQPNDLQVHPTDAGKPAKWVKEVAELLGDIAAKEGKFLYDRKDGHRRNADEIKRLIVNLVRTHGTDTVNGWVLGNGGAK